MILVIHVTFMLCLLVIEPITNVLTSRIAFKATKGSTSIVRLEITSHSL